jgi:hypothetical protein
MPNIYSLSYCIPDEYIVSDAEFLSGVMRKTKIIADIIPGKLETYRFGADDETAYYDLYKSSFFAYTMKKGGWDCLRHYEIMASGCIPIFPDLAHCPTDTLFVFPKQLIMEANRELLPWKHHKIIKYCWYVLRILDHMRKTLSCSAVASTFLYNMQREARLTRPIQKILLIQGHTGVNYSRELLWIGVKRHLQQQGGVAIDWPKIGSIYTDIDVESRRKLYGFGYTYSGKLEQDYVFIEETVREWIRQKKWDVVVYGKVGPDEGPQGSFPNMPLWDEVSRVYSAGEIAFIYGGDGMQDMLWENNYSRHLWGNQSRAVCFVREYKTI